MRDKWNTKLGFLIAAIGSAVGLGNIWRFPYTAGTNGGGAFLIPYFFAIITAGIPILILEYTIGKKFKGGAPVALARINKKFEFLGWAQIMVAFVIFTYYFAIVVWVVKYLLYSFNQGWGDDPQNFFFGDFLAATDSPLQFGGVNFKLIVPFVIVWAITLFILFRGVSRGIEIVCKICLPVLVFLIMILVIRGITLPGAAEGLEYMFKPDWSLITKPTVWIAAYGQVFYSLSICFAIMIAYSSYLPRETDVVNSAFITATANHGFELFAGIGVFSIVGFMAQSQGQDVADIASGGIGLAFISFPTAISKLPALNTLVGICFFGALLTAGMTSLISIAQAIISGIEDKFKFSHNKTVLLIAVPSIIISFMYVTNAGILILDIVDNFINTIGIVGCGVIEVLLISWCADIKGLRNEANLYSNFSIGKWWIYMLKFVSTIVLGIMLIWDIITIIKDGYGGYELNGLIVFGWGSILVVAIGSFILTRMKGKDGYADLQKISQKEVN